MRKRDVPRRVAADAVAREEHAVGIDRKPPAGVAERAQHGIVLAGRIVVRMFWLQPFDGDRDVAVPRGLAEWLAVGPRRAGPEIDLCLRVDAGVGERDDHRIMAERIVFRRQLHR